MVRRRHPALVETGPGDDATALETTEYFAPVLGVVELPGNGQEFLDAAVAHANDRLVGTLGANVLIDPATQAALGDGFENAIADLRYGSIAINAWTAFALPHADAHLGRLPRGDARRTSRAASASCTTRCCSTASSDRSPAGRSVRSPARRPRSFGPGRVLGPAEAAVVRRARAPGRR